MVAASFGNTSYEIGDGTVGVLLSNNAEPYDLSSEGEINIVIDRGDPQSITFEKGTRSTITSANTAPFSLADLQTLDVAIDGAPSVTVTFNTANFVDITNATAEEVATELLTQLPGTAFVQVVGTAVLIGSLTKGASSLIDVSGGTAAAAFAFPAGVAGVDHFVDISVATAAEVATRITAQLIGGTAQDQSGQVELTSSVAGADGCVEVLGGTASPAFDFPSGEVCGQTEAGVAQSWNLATSASLFEFAEFGNGLVFPSAFENYTLGWPGSPGAEDDLTSLPAQSTVMFFFVGDLLAEEFNWFSDAMSLPALVDAAFNLALTPTAREEFDQGWPTVPGSEADIYVLGTLTDALFDTTFDPFEDFDQEWNGNEDDETTLGTLAVMVPGQGGQYETFEPFTAVHTEIEIFTVNSGNAYEVGINGEPCVYVAQGGDNPEDVAQELTDCINNSPQEVSASVDLVNARIQITNLATDPTPFEVSATGTIPSEIGKVFGFAVDPGAGWTGADENNYC